MITKVTGDGKPLHRPGISQEMLISADVRWVGPKEAESSCGIRSAGLFIPYWKLDGSPINEVGKQYGRLRLDEPFAEHKYHQQKKSGVHAYLTPGLSELEAKSPLFLVEGEFKALALCEAGFPAIGLPGLYSTSQSKLIPELATVLNRLCPSRIYYCGDSDTCLNWQFSDAVLKFSALARQPVTILLPRVPFNGPGKGVDDCRETLGSLFDGWWRDLITNAVQVPIKATVGDLCIALLQPEVDALKSIEDGEQALLKRGLVAMAARLESEPLNQDEVKEIVAALGLRKRLFEKEIKQYRKVQKAEVIAQGIVEGRSIFNVTVREQYGDPWYYDAEYRITQINEGYWAGVMDDENHLLYEPGERQFYLYDENSGLWVPTSDAAIRERISQRIISVSREISDLQLERKITDTKLRAICSRLEGISEHQGAFDEPHDDAGNRWHVHCTNGVLELGGQGLNLLEFSPLFLSRNQIPVAFDPDALCERFLNELLLPAISEEDVSLVQRWFGCAILQRNFPQRILILDGNAGTGKSQLANLANFLVGSANCATLRTGHLNSRFELYGFRRKTLLSGPDVAGRFLLTEGSKILKSLVGGDLIEAEGKNWNDRVLLTGHFNVIITCNERLKVQIEGDTDAWRRRLLIVRFEARPPEKKIPDFARLLFREEGSGILTWAVAGAVELLSGFKEIGADYRITEDQRIRIESLLAESESVRHFLNDCVEKVKGCDISKGELLDSYAEYCASSGWVPMKTWYLNRCLDDLMLEVFQSSRSNSLDRSDSTGKTKYVAGYRGVRLRE